MPHSDMSTQIARACGSLCIGSFAHHAQHATRISPEPNSKGWDHTERECEPKRCASLTAAQRSTALHGSPLDSDPAARRAGVELREKRGSVWVGQ